MMLQIMKFMTKTSNQSFWKPWKEKMEPCFCMVKQVLERLLLWSEKLNKKDFLCWLKKDKSKKWAIKIIITTIREIEHLSNHKLEILLLTEVLFLLLKMVLILLFLVTPSIMLSVIQSSFLLTIFMKKEKIKMGFYLIVWKIFLTWFKKNNKN